MVTQPSKLLLDGGVQPRPLGLGESDILGFWRSQVSRCDRARLRARHLPVGRACVRRRQPPILVVGRGPPRRERGRRSLRGAEPDRCAIEARTTAEQRFPAGSLSFSRSARSTNLSEPHATLFARRVP